MAHAILSELSQISCEIYINKCTHLYDISYKNILPALRFVCFSKWQIYGSKEAPLPTLGFFKVLVRESISHAE